MNADKTGLYGEPYARTWPGLDVPVHKPHPAPLVGARPAREREIPSAARTVRKQAEAAGWRVVPTYALGWVLGARGDVRSLTHSLALRMNQGAMECRCVAVWTVKEPSEELAREAVNSNGEFFPPTSGWKFDLAYIWGAGQPHHKLSAAALKAYLKEVPDGGVE